jgi:hypothetical protein
MKGQMDLRHFVEVLKPVLFPVSAANMCPMLAIIKHWLFEVLAFSCKTLVGFRV